MKNCVPLWNVDPTHIHTHMCEKWEGDANARCFKNSIAPVIAQMLTIPAFWGNKQWGFIQF